MGATVFIGGGHASCRRPPCGRREEPLRCVDINRAQGALLRRGSVGATVFIGGGHASCRSPPCGRRRNPCVVSTSIAHRVRSYGGGSVGAAGAAMPLCDRPKASRLPPLPQSPLRRRAPCARLISTQRKDSSRRPQGGLLRDACPPPMKTAAPTKTLTCDPGAGLLTTEALTREPDAGLPAKAAQGRSNSALMV